MRSFYGFAGACWVLAASMSAQEAPKPKAVAWRQKTITFTEEKPVLGLPVGPRSKGVCEADGVMFFSLNEDAATVGGSAVPVLYRMTPGGETRQLLRMEPKEFSSTSVLDFFVGEHTVGTLFRTEGPKDGSPREVRYFLSLSDHDGDGASLLPLDVKFRPLKLALFPSGDFFLLGWDEANMLPVLAVMKNDGTVRRFMDLDNRRPDVTSADRERATAKSLSGAALVAFGSEVLLTYPGTAKGIRVLGPVGEDRYIPLQLPAGFLLHDVVFSGAHYTLVVRAQAADDFPKDEDDKPVAAPRQRLFEMDANHGGLIREFLFEKPKIADVTCAANYSLTAIFMDTVAKAMQGSSANDKSPVVDGAVELVVSTVRR